MGSGGSPESLNIMDFHIFFYDFFGGVGSVGRPESLKMFGCPCIRYDFLGGVGSVGSSESLKKQRFIYIFIFLRWSGKRGKPGSLKMYRFL